MTFCQVPAHVYNIVSYLTVLFSAGYISLGDYPLSDCPCSKGQWLL